MYAGPLPEIAVTALRCFSASRTTRPHELSSASASARWSSVQWLPGEMPAIPWSTSAGVLGMTRMTDVPSGSRDSRNSVVMPAASEMTALPGATWSWISSSSAAMSCGLTHSTSVSATSAASALASTRTPWRSARALTFSGVRPVTTRSPGVRPERMRPETRVSPMTPAPKMAVVVIVALRSALGRDAAQEEHDVGGLLGHPAHEVAVPLLAVRDVDAHLVAAVGDPLLLLGADAVEHLVLERPRVATGLARERAGDLDEPRVVRGHHRVALALHEDLEAPDVGLVDVGSGLEGDRLGLLVGALAEPDTGPGVGEVPAVGLGAVEVGLHDGAHRREVGPQLAQGVEGQVGGRVVLHVEGHGRAALLGQLADLTGVVQGDGVAVARQRLPERAQLERDLDGAALGEALVAQRRQQREVGVARVPGLGEVGRVLAEVVDRREAAGRRDLGGGPDDVGTLGTGHEALDDRARHGRLLDDVSDLLLLGQLQERVAQQVAGVHGGLRVVLGMSLGSRRRTVVTAPPGKSTAAGSRRPPVPSAPAARTPPARSLGVLLGAMRQTRCHGSPERHPTTRARRPRGRSAASRARRVRPAGRDA